MSLAANAISTLSAIYAVVVAVAEVAAAYGTDNGTDAVITLGGVSIAPVVGGMDEAVTMGTYRKGTGMRIH